MKRFVLGMSVLLLPLAASAKAGNHPVQLEIPIVAPGPSRDITNDDLIALRDMDAMTLAPDGRTYAVLVRQARPATNSYVTGWFSGETKGGQLTWLADGGNARLRETGDGRRVGILVGSPGRWSPDSRWLAFTASHDGEVQLWIASANGRARRQLTHHEGDIRDFAWSEDGSKLLFTVGTARATLSAREEAAGRNGYLLEDFQFTNEIIHDARPERPLETELSVWTVGADGRGVRLASPVETAAFKRAEANNFSWGRSQPVGSEHDLGGAAAPPIVATDGALVWPSRVNPKGSGELPFVRLTASRKSDGSDPVSCPAEECVAQMFGKIWWSEDSKRVIFWRKEDVNLVENGFYTWSPDSGEVRRLYRNDGDEFRECELANERLVCVRETIDRPAHVARIDLATGVVDILADLNPEFRNLRLGKVERFEWDAAEDIHKIGYPRRLFGYIIYPPDFDPARKYPVFIAPYGAPGFRRGDVGDEHPLFVYAANGIVVLSTQFPVALGTAESTMPSKLSDLYSAKNDFPHLTMLAESTFRALDAVSARGFLDLTRVGIGGLSHGSFVPLYMAQKYDRLAALSIAGPGWSQREYYSSTRTGRTLLPGASDWPESADFWSKIDIADHVEAIEAPLLVNYPDREFFHDWRLPRRMENAGRAFEAHIFPDEFHVKWQSAHRNAIYNRNLDWFRFWLQDLEDPDQAKQAQYSRWRALRQLQCRNPRSVRNYCVKP